MPGKQPGVDGQGEYLLSERAYQSVVVSTRQVGAANRTGEYRIAYDGELALRTIKGYAAGACIL